MMKLPKRDKPMTRRDWLGLCGRGAVAAGVATLSGVLLSRSSAEGDESRSCDRPRCSQCDQSETCYLPRAIAYRKRKDLA
jgi:hypothetical protein